MKDAVAGDLHCFVADSVAVAGAAEGPLAGRDFVAKDLFAMRGRVSSFGSARWRETHPAASETADVVTALLGAGARLAGLTVMDQLAYSLIGNVGEGEPPVNPRDPERFTGGSSSGTASAVAGKLADLGVGTDTAGSIRVPAAACGIRAIRPTHGVLSVRGAVPLAPSFDVVGLCSRSADVLLEAFRILAGTSANGTPAIEELLLATDVLGDVDGGEEIARGARDLAAGRGVRVREVAFRRFAGEAAAGLLSRLQGAEIWRTHGAWVEANGDALDVEVRERLEMCKSSAARPAEEREADARERERFQAAFSEIVGETRAVVLPVLVRETPLCTANVDDLRDFRARTLRLTAAASLCGAPQVVLPAGASAIGILGPLRSDVALLRLSRAPRRT